MLTKSKLIILIYFLLTITAKTEIVEQIKTIGNNRISSETIKMFSGINLSDDVNENQINNSLKNLYDTNYFKDINITLKDKILLIEVVENPLIEEVIINGVKAKKFKDAIYENIKLKPRTSFNQTILENDKKIISNLLKDQSYYFSKIDILSEELNNNLVKLNINVDLGEKAKIKKISFIGDKIFKDKKLKNIIISEEFKFWKFISGKKYLNENIVEIDKRLLKNFYLNKGYYNVTINTSFAKIINENNFELIFNINANNKVVFGKLNLDLPIDYNLKNFEKINEILDESENKPYSLSNIEKIIKEIEEISTYDEYESTNVIVLEDYAEDVLNLDFKIEETEKKLIRKINIYGNNVTRENVIRNQFIVDEGDFYNEILIKKSINNIKNLNFFKNVTYEIENDETKTSDLIINITVEEKPTGEIAAGAGVGTEGGTFQVNLNENNYLGKGINLSSSLTLSEEVLRGNLTIFNPNYKNSDNSVYFNLQSLETDRLSTFGYKSNKNGFSVSTNFEYLDDLRVGLGTSNYYEKISTDSTASARQQSQKGNYWDTFLNLDFILDKRNQKYQTNDGYLSNYAIDLPIISENFTLINSYDYKYYTELYDENISSFSFFFKSANSLNNKNIKLSERLVIPSSKLRGFESGKVGPKDGSDFIGGNFVSAINFNSTLPKILENNQNLDISMFFDAANIWSVDYNSALDDSQNIRTSLGLAFDWLTPIGPLSFTFSQPITKKSTDVTETFRFNLGTTF